MKGILLRRVWGLGFAMFSVGCSFAISEQKTDHVFESLKRRIYAAIIGAAYADALGGVTEFYSVPEQLRHYPSGVASVRDLRKGDFRRNKSGKQILAYTDDTGMALVVLRILIESHAKSYSLEQTMDSLACAFVEDMNKSDGWAVGFRAPGNTCLGSCMKLEQKLAAAKNRNALPKGWWGVGPGQSKGCGSVMRAYPFGIVFAHDYKKAAQWAAQHSRITHGHPAALAACAAIAAGVAVAITADEKMSADDVVAIMIEQARQYDKHTASMIAQAAQDAKRGVSEKKILQAPVGSKQLLQGWVADEAIAAAVYIFVRSPRDIERAIKLGVNSTGDSDSIASIAAALVGAYCGQSPKSQETQQLESIDELRVVAEKATNLLQFK